MRACPVCEGREASPRWEVCGYTLLTCGRCGAWYLAEEAAADYGEAYLDRGASAGDRLTGYFDYEAERALHLHNFQANLRILGAYTQPGRLLDVGCASGHFLEAAAAAGWRGEGVDVSVAAVRRVVEELGLPARAGDVRTMALEPRYDAITLWETVEHLPEPVSVLRHLRAGLAPGGLLAIGTGDTESPVARLLGRRWWYVNPPDHCVYYNTRALCLLLERAGMQVVGLERIHTHHVGGRNVALKVARSLEVAPRVALGLARRLPDVVLPIWHGTTRVVLAKAR